VNRKLAVAGVHDTTSSLKRWRRASGESTTASKRRTLTHEILLEESAACAKAIHSPLGDFVAAECEYIVKVFNNFVEIHVEMPASLLEKPYPFDRKSSLHYFSAIHHSPKNSASLFASCGNLLHT
jgi:hypothetical protein